jgi:hypothetical protein
MQSSSYFYTIKFHSSVGTEKRSSQIAINTVDFDGNGKSVSPRSIRNNLLGFALDSATTTTQCEARLPSFTSIVFALTRAIVTV